MKLKTKITSHITFNGKQEIGEKQFKKSIKTFQKKSKKKSHQIFKLALTSSAPIFKLHKIKNKRKKRKKTFQKFVELPGFIKNDEARISLSIKFLLKNAKKKKTIFYKELNHEIVTSAFKKSSTIKNQIEQHQNIFSKKRYLFYYK